MTIVEMHNAFRTLGQQMGMQSIRGILPESIDVYLNNAIIDTVRANLTDSIKQNLIGAINTNVSSVSAINMFRTLIKTARYSIDTNIVGDTKKVYFYNALNGYHVLNIPIVNANIEIGPNEYEIKSLSIVGVSVEYDNNRGDAIPCRIINADEIDTTRRDFCNKPTSSEPVIVSNYIAKVDTTNGFNDVTPTQLEFYSDTPNCKIRYINIKYIKLPNVVRNDGNPTTSVNCDLPEYLHGAIVELAVAKYLQSVGVTVPNHSNR